MRARVQSPLGPPDRGLGKTLPPTWFQGYRDAEEGRLTWVVVGRYGVLGNPVAGALVKNDETAAAAIVTRRVYSAVSSSAARRAA